MEHIAIDDKEVVLESAKIIISILENAAKKTEKDLVIALSGGGSPKLLFPVLASHMPSHLVTRLKFIQVDERIVAPNHTDSNQYLVNTTLTPLLLKGAGFFPMPVESHAPESCASYESLLAEFFEDDLPVLAILGAGDDGHTASIFPDQKSELPTDDNFVFMTPREKNGYYRMSLSAHALYTFQTALLYVPGLQKQDIVKKIIDKKNASLYPACEIIHTHKNGIIIASA